MFRSWGRCSGSDCSTGRKADTTWGSCCACRWRQELALGWLGTLRTVSSSNRALTFVEVLQVLVLVVTGVPVVALTVLAGLYDKYGLVTLHDCFFLYLLLS